MKGMYKEVSFQKRTSAQEVVGDWGVNESNPKYYQTAEANPPGVMPRMTRSYS